MHMSKTGCLLEDIKIWTLLNMCGGAEGPITTGVTAAGGEPHSKVLDTVTTSGSFGHRIVGP